MDKQPSPLTEQVTVILSPDPQAREIGPDLLREAALDMGLRSEFEDFISDVPSLFMVFNPVAENRPFAQTIADAMPVSRQHDMIKFAINHSLNEHCDGYATIRAGRLIEFVYDPCKNEPEGIDRGSMLATLSENLYRFSGRKDNMLTNEKLVKLVKHYPYGSQCFTPEDSADGPVAASRPDGMTTPVAVENLPILSDDILEVNDEAWVIYHGDVYPCDVEDMPDCPYKDIDTITIRIADGIGLHEVNRTDVFLRKADAGAALRFREYKAMHAYLQEIKTLDDLHQFPLTHVLTGPEPDYAARMAYEIKRMELNP